MDVVLFSRPKVDAIVNCETEGLFPRIALMYSDKVNISNLFSEIIFFGRKKIKGKEQNYIRMFEMFYCKDPYNLDFQPGSIYKFYADLKKIRGIKNKVKTTLIVLHQQENMLKNIISDVDTWFSFQINHFQLEPLFPFVDDELLLLLANSSYDEYSIGDDPFLRSLVDCYNEYKHDVAFDQVIEKLVPFKRLDKETETNSSNDIISSGEEPFFYSMELFEFPIIIDLNYPQLLNVRNELKPLMDAFDEDHEKFKKEIADKSFKNDKPDYYLSMFNKFITPHLKEIQAAIDKNIYIQQEKNTYSPDQSVKVMLGITSIENQVSLLEKEEIIMPLIANSIIDKLKKNLDVDNCAPFVYHVYPENINQKLIKEI